MRFVVEDGFWALFPEALIGMVVAHGVNNQDGDRADLAALLANAAASAASAVSGVEVAGHLAVAPWRRAYASFGAKPSKFRSSIERLLRSAAAGRVRSINPLVDLYNVVSLRYLLPCGGEDLAAIQGDIRLTHASGDEHFVPLGAAEEDPPERGEVIYRDDVGAICRCWNWREAERTKLTPTTTDAFLCIEALPENGEERLRDACHELAGLIRDYLGGDARVELVSRVRPSVSI